MDALTSALGHFKLKEPNLEPKEPTKAELVEGFTKHFDSLSLSFSDLMFEIPEGDLKTIQVALDKIYEVIEKWEVEFER